MHFHARPIFQSQSALSRQKCRKREANTPFAQEKQAPPREKRHRKLPPSDAPRLIL